MFTVKHITADGTETLHAAFRTELRCNPHRVLGFTNDNFVVCEIQVGVVYITNDAGKTVASYHLDELSR